MISDGADSTLKIWDLSNNTKIPLDVFYDTETTICSADYRSKDFLHLALDDDGNVVARNLKSQNKCKKIKLPSEDYKLIKFNTVNDNQFFISSEQSFKVFDIRTYTEIRSCEMLSNSSHLLNDTNQFLIGKPSSLCLFEGGKSDVSFIREWEEVGNTTMLNMNDKNFTDPEIIAIGNDKGDVFFSG